MRSSKPPGRAWAAVVLALTVLGGAGTALGAGVAPLHVIASVAARLATAPVVTYTAVDFVDGRAGFVGGESGRRGAVWRTTDAGRTWHVAALGPVSPTALDFVDAMDGFALAAPTDMHCPADGCPNVVLATTDGGRAWHDALSEAAAASRSLFLNAIAFTTGREGYALGERHGCHGAITCNTGLYRTENGGRTWTALGLGGVLPTSVHFATATTGAVGGFACAQGDCRAVVLTTTDAGRRFTLRHLPLPPYPEDSVGSVDVDDTNAEDGFVLATPPGGTAMGGGFGPLLGTTDGGRTWTEEHASFAWGSAPRGALPGFPGDLAFTSARTGWLAVAAGAGSGVGGVDLTRDGGVHFSRIGGLQGWSITQVAPAGPHQAWAVGAPKLFGASFVVHLWSDGRTVEALPAPAPEAAVALLDGGGALGVGLPAAPGAILARTGANAPWRVVAHLPVAALTPTIAAVRPPSGTTAAAWVEGEVQGTTTWAIWQSTDGGHRWRRVRVADHPWIGLAFFPGGLGVAVESSSFAGSSPARLVTTRDGGRTFVPGPPVPVGAELMAASFATARIGYVVTLDPGANEYTVWRTTDGAERWRRLGALPFTGSTVLLDASGRGAVWLYADGDLDRSMDDGAEWTRATLDAAPAAMSFLGPERGMLVGESTAPLTTADGGRVWSRAPEAG
jgi:photosystem II stability/assembly factor-like uncharacterized protein